MNHYLNGFIESAWVASIIPLGSEPTFFAMKAFGGYNMVPAFFLALAGAAIGYSFNWGLGKILARLRTAQGAKPVARWQERGKELFTRYGIFMLLFCWLPMMNLLLIIAGALGVRLSTALALSVSGAAIYYGMAFFS